MSELERVGAGPSILAHPEFPDHALLDSGDGAKLERYGDVWLARPDPQALWRPRSPELWDRAHLVFEPDPRSGGRGGRWRAGPDAPEHARGRDASWTIRYRSAVIEIRPTPFKHVGVFPEQASNWDWIESRRARLGDGPRLLNLFGYTGVASILAAQAGFEVTHVDASRTTLGWLRSNASASGLSEDALRIVLDDALAFASRELRRDSSYAAILIDPPAYGRGPKGEKWVFESGIQPLLELCGALLADASVLVLSSYAIGTTPLALENLLRGLPEGRVTAGELALPEEDGARSLPCGFTARWER